MTGLGGFSPGTFGDGAVLENVGGARADGGDVFVVAVSHAVLLDDHGDNNGGGDLDQLATFGSSGGLGEVGGAVVSQMRITGSVGAEIGVGGGVVVIESIEGAPVAKVETEVGDKRLGGTLGIFGAGGAGAEQLVHVFGEQAGEAFGIGGVPALGGVPGRKVAGRGK